MTLRLVWTCDEPGCSGTTSKTADDPTLLSMPRAWTYRAVGDWWAYTCPARHEAVAVGCPLPGTAGVHAAWYLDGDGPCVWRAAARGAGMRRWLQRTIALTCAETPTEMVDVKAWVFGALALHRTMRMPWVHARWCVTHVPTGRHISSANTERLARRFVREVAPLLDWETATTLTEQSPEVSDALNAARLRAHSGTYVSEVRIG